MADTTRNSQNGKQLWSFKDLPVECMAGTHLEKITDDLLPLIGSFNQRGLIKPTYNFQSVILDSKVLQSVWTLGFDRNRHLVVAHDSCGQVSVWARDGQLMRKFGQPGKEVGDLGAPAGLALNLQDGTIVVSEFSNNRIQIFDEEGKSIKIIGSEGAQDGQLKGPMDVAFTREGNIAVADSGNSRIQVFSPKGEFLMKFSTFTDTTGFSMPSGVKIDHRNGNFVVIDHRKQKVIIYSPEGTLIKSFTGVDGDPLGKSYTLDIDNDGNLIIPDYRKSKIQIFDPEGTFLREFGKPPNDRQEDVPPECTVQPKSLALDLDGRIFVCGTDDGGFTIAAWA